jgi:hypothetical protein
MSYHTITSSHHTCNNVKSSCIFNLDQTTVHLDSPRNQTYAQKGSNKVVVQHTESIKTRLAVLFSALADFTKLPVLVIVPRNKSLPGVVFPSNVIDVYRQSGTFNSDVMMHKYINQIFRPHVLKLGIQNPIIFLDRTPCHRNIH